MGATAEYFVGEILIPNITGSDLASLSNKANLQWFIDKYESEYLTYLLGEDLFAEYSAGLIAIPVQAKWTSLKNMIYVSAKSQGGAMMSPVAFYIWFFWSRNQATQTLQNGEGQPSMENATMVYPSAKQISAWNQMSRMSDEIMEWLEENHSTYPSYDALESNYLQPMNSIFF